MTPDEVRLLDNSKCILFIRGERPVIDRKYNLLKHPNIRYTEDGGAAPYDYTAAGNALEECSGAKDTGAIKALLREHGAVTALMTGSGAAVFGVFRDEGAARAAAQAAKRRWKQVYVAQPDRGGARVSR